MRLIVFDQVAFIFGLSGLHDSMSKTTVIYESNAEGICRLSPQPINGAIFWN